MKKIRVKVRGNADLLFNARGMLELPDVQAKQILNQATQGDKEAVTQICELKVHRDKNNGGEIYVPGTAMQLAIIAGCKNVKVKVGSQKKAATSVFPGNFIVNEDELSLHKKTWDYIHEVWGTNPNNKAAIKIWRPAFKKGWELEFTVSYNELMLHPNVIKDIFEKTGREVGIMSWTPKKMGNKGTFEIVEFEPLDD